VTSKGIRADVLTFLANDDIDGLCDYIRDIRFEAFQVGSRNPSTKTPASLPSPNIPSTNGDS